jgi:uncharacterized membrane protein
MIKVGVFLFDYSFYELAWLFIIYAFLGWCLEVAIAKVQTGNFVNRGFLNGPFCPIYSFGAIAVIVLLSPLKSNLPVLFIGSVILTTIIEFVTGYILEKTFNQKWWDYKDEPLNIKGYICLWTSLAWGVACVIVIYFLQPPINSLIHWFSNDIGNIIAISLIIILIADLVVTIYSLSKVRQKIITLKDMSDKIGLMSKNISDNNRQELDSLKTKYQAIIDKKIIGYNRIIKAFPRLNSDRPKTAKNKLK